ncbi:MAG: signal peptidase I [Brevefilum sp.]
MDAYNESELTPEIEETGAHKRSKGSGCVGFIIDTVETILLALVLFLAINTLTARVRVENVSMKPTLQPGEFLLVNRVAYKLGDPSIGDIIVFHAPGVTEMDYIKRIVGLPGDLVMVSEGTVTVNNEPLYEPYIADSPNYNGEWVVPEGQYFVLGDNRNNSSDSHLWGFVPHEDIVGKALLVYWPLSEAGLLTHPNVVQAVQD